MAGGAASHLAEHVGVEVGRGQHLRELRLLLLEALVDGLVRVRVGVRVRVRVRVSPLLEALVDGLP